MVTPLVVGRGRLWGCCLHRPTGASRFLARFDRCVSGRSGSIRGRPNCGNTLLSANHVIAEILFPSSVRISSENARARTVGTGLAYCTYEVVRDAYGTRRMATRA